MSSNPNIYKWLGFLIDAVTIFRDAIEEILRDTCRIAVQAELSGSWKPPRPRGRINHRLFNNTIAQTLQSNRRRHNNKKKSSSTSGLKKPSE
jgi:hypothetical protein